MAAPVAGAAALGLARRAGPRKIAGLIIGTVLALSIIPGALVLGLGVPIAMAVVSASSTVAGGGPGSWVMPTTGVLTDGFGPRERLCNHAGCSSGFHRAQDIGAACGTPVVAAAAGVVTRTASGGTWGNRIYIDHGNGISTQYNHLQAIHVTTGAQVAPGMPIGEVGDDGLSFGCHLDFMVQTPEGWVDPLLFLRSHGVSI